MKTEGECARRKPQWRRSRAPRFDERHQPRSAALYAAPARQLLHLLQAFEHGDRTADDAQDTEQHTAGGYQRRIPDAVKERVRGPKCVDGDQPEQAPWRRQ